GPAVRRRDAGGTAKATRVSDTAAGLGRGDLGPLMPVPAQRFAPVNVSGTVAPDRPAVGRGGAADAAERACRAGGWCGHDGPRAPVPVQYPVPLALPDGPAVPRRDAPDVPHPAARPP